MPHGKHTTKALAKAAYRAGIEAQAELEAAASVKTGRTHDGQVVKDVKRQTARTACTKDMGNGIKRTFCLEGNVNCPAGTRNETDLMQLKDTRKSALLDGVQLNLKPARADNTALQECNNNTGQNGEPIIGYWNSKTYPGPRPCYPPEIKQQDCVGFTDGGVGIVADVFEAGGVKPLADGVFKNPVGSYNCLIPTPTPSQSSSSYISSAITTAMTVVPSMMTPVSSMMSATPTAAIAAATLPEVSVIGIAVGSFAGGVVVTLSCLAAYKFGSWLCKPKEIVTVQAIFDQGRDAAPRIHLVRENSRRGDKDRSRPQSTASTEPSPTRSEPVNLHGSRNFDPDPPRAPAPLPPDIDEAGYSTVGWLPQLPIHHARRRNDFSTSSEPAVPTQSNYQRPRLATTYQTMNSVSLLSVSQVNTESPAPSPMDIDHMNPLYHSNTPL